MRQEHNPVGNPCIECGKPRSVHRQRSFHQPFGDPCQICGLSASKHQGRSYHLSQGDPCSKCGLAESTHPDYFYVGIDGEGLTRSGKHDYIMLGAVSEDWSIRETVEDPNCLSTRQCLDFLLGLELPRRSRVFGFSLGYDWTKILEDLDNRSLYLLFRPHLRRRKLNPERGPRPIYWEGYWLNWQAGKTTISRKRNYDSVTGLWSYDRIVIWDLFKFYQCKFVTALQRWKVGEQQLLDDLQRMKEQRGRFKEAQRAEIRDYMLSECRNLALLGHKLVQAHKDAGLTLTKFYGAGSTGATILQLLGIREKIREPPEEMRRAVACAFFGGRFENSWLGAVKQPIVSWDISSAYPYQTVFLPCLEHAKWEHTTRRSDLDNARFACVHYDLTGGAKPRINSWGPYPFRDRHGNIIFPLYSHGGWVWLDEYLEGEKHWPQVGFKEAWVYKSNCDCRPFARVAGYYIERLKLSKDGAGIVIKLGLNSIYGKLAQSLGLAPFQCWIWAGIITSGCRAQMLGVIGQHKNPWDILMIATDGLFTLDKSITPPLPRDTGTQAAKEYGKEPLGGWERKDIKSGMFCARPGVYFALDPNVDPIVKARGLGTRIVKEQYQSILEHFWRHGSSVPITLQNLPRFCGAKTSIHAARIGGVFGFVRNETYGHWIKRPQCLSFDPLPKRTYRKFDPKQGELFDRLSGLTESHNRLMCRDLRSLNHESTPYARALSRDALILKAASDVLAEQP